MKIVIPLFSLEHHGGTRDIVEIANYLAGKGHRIIIYVPFDRIKEHYRLSEKVYVKKIPVKGRGKINQFIVFLYYLFKLEEADLYIANFFPTLYPLYLRGFLKKTPIAYFVQDIEYRFVRFPINMLAFFTYILPSRKIALSHYLKDSIGGKKVKVARAGVSDEFLTKPLKARSFDGELVVGHIVRKEPLKNSKLFLNAVDKIVDMGFSVILVGDKKRLKPYIHKGVKIIPYGNSDYLRDKFYDTIDIFVHTSFVEGFGLPPLEAMARGCVVLLTQSGGPKEYATQKNSITIDKYDLMDLVNKLNKFPQNREILKSLSQNALKTALNHPMSRIGGEFETSLKELNLLK